MAGCEENQSVTISSGGINGVPAFVYLHRNFRIIVTRISFTSPGLLQDCLLPCHPFACMQVHLEYFLGHCG